MDGKEGETLQAMYEAICMQIQTLQHRRRKSSKVTDEMLSRRRNALLRFGGY